MTIEESQQYYRSLQKQSEGITKLSILIPTVPSRAIVFNHLYQEFIRQIEVNGFKGRGVEEWKTTVETEEGPQETFTRFKHPDIVELIYDKSNRLVGDKRNDLLEKAKGEYLCFFDDDDYPANDYVKLIMNALKDNPDCVSLKGVMTTDGQAPEIFEHSIKYDKWDTVRGEVKYIRYPNHLNTIRSEIAKQFKFPSLNVREDHIWAEQIFNSGLLKKEAYIDRILYNYRYVTNKAA
jgi:glycosyltransferase involved in cell wall biosynthesis